MSRAVDDDEGPWYQTQTAVFAAGGLALIVAVLLLRQLGLVATGVAVAVALLVAWWLGRRLGEGPKQ